MRKTTTLVGAGLLTVATASGAVAAATVATVASTTKDVVVSSTSNKSLGTTGGTRTVIASAAFPAGSWVLTLHATMVNFGPSDYGRCELYQGATAIAGATATVGDPAQAGNRGPASLVSTLSLAYGVTLAAPTTMSVQCSHDSTNGSTPYVDASASLVAHKSPALLDLFQ